MAKAQDTADARIPGGIDPPVGTVGDSIDNALAECVIGLLETEIINEIGRWDAMRKLNGKR